ncbi:cytochrome P450 [Mesorhizobium sp. ASY16-5R]|uniref:cytochrome P450 n=1 Tax=Mesorhizobium sp. ASY16-5R TaxID=3445772 RepID=UPI003F9F2428
MQFPCPQYLTFDLATRRLILAPHAPAFVQDPYQAYRWMHADARCVFWENYRFWCFAGYDEVNRLFRDRRFGRERPGGYRAAVAATGERCHLADFDAVEAGSLLELEPPAHTRLRTLVNRAFVSRQVERLRPKIETLAHALIDGFESAGRAELIRDFATPLPAAVIAEMMGLPAESGLQLVAWSNDMVRMYMHKPSRAHAEHANASARAFADFIRRHAAEKRRQPGDDLLSLLTAAHEDGQKLSEDELVSSAILLLNAGHEATVHQTGNAVKAILSQGGDPCRFFATPELSAATVEECLRYDAPLHMFTRYAYEDVDFGNGATVRAGDQIGLLLAAANRDPLAFSDPDEFRPGRPDQKNVSFGAGIHFCIGAPLARLELQISLKTLFDRLPQLRLADAPQFGDTYHFHGLSRLDTTFDRQA